MWVTRRRGILKRKRSIHAGNIVTPGVLWVIHISASGHEKSEEFCFTEDEPALQGRTKTSFLILEKPLQLPIRPHYVRRRSLWRVAPRLKRVRVHCRAMRHNDGLSERAKCITAFYCLVYPYLCHQ